MAVVTVNAMIHSIGGISQAEIMNFPPVDNNEVIARYRGKYYTAIYNPFTNLFYVDDKYGELSKSRCQQLGLV